MTLPSGAINILVTDAGTCMVGRALKDLLVDLKMPEKLPHLN
jgi:hypothetical protein